MLKVTRIGAAALMALGSGLAAPALAQDDSPSKLERVEVTGSSIKRISGEGALPVTTLTQSDIQKTGATSITELIQNLPSMQGFVPASSSVNGGGAGVTTAALHSLPSKYTLVLLDGKRIAPLALNNSQGGGFGVNLESIPLDAIERVEILTDGASATYGSDAISGVVNFILKKNKTDGNVSATFNKPQHPGGASWNAALSKGFGNLDSDGFNILLSYSHDVQKQLGATQRSFSAQGAYFPVSSGGKNYIVDQRTGNTEPANISFSAYPTGTTGTQQQIDDATVAYALNPYYTGNGNCGGALAGVQINPPGAIGVSCRFNYAATVQDIPSTKRDSAFAKTTFKLGEDASIWAELNLTRFDMTAQYAPSAQPLSLSATRNSALFNAYVLPYLSANNLTLAGTSATMGYRSVSMGGRADDYRTQATHFATGIDGQFKGWDYNASLVLSKTQFTDRAAGGYSDQDLLVAAIADGSYDPVMGTSTVPISSFVLQGTEFSKSTSTLSTVHLGAQHDLFQLPGGMSVLALGGDFTSTRYRTAYGDLVLAGSGYSTQPVDANGVPLSDTPVGGNAGLVPFDADRTNWGLFGELLMPVTKRLEITASARYDSYSKTHSKFVFGTNPDPVSGVIEQLPNADLGNTFNAATGKLSIRFTPIDELLLRASYGTGFKAPNITDIASPVTFGGSTAGTYACPIPGAAGCLPGSAQYDLLAGGNGASGDQGLKPEKSRQWTLGFRADPAKSVSFGMDLWEVRIKNQVLSQGIAEKVGFTGTGPSQYSYLFVNPYIDPVGGFTTIGFKQLPFNGGQAEYQGIDWDLSYRTKLPFGDLSLQWSGTQMLKQRYNFGAGQAYNTDLGRFGPDQQVVFRTMMNVVASLQTGSFVNTLAMHYKSGYKDQIYGADEGVIFLANPDGTAGAASDFAGLHVKPYMTFDWQLKYTMTKSIQLTGGIKNLFDKDPPLTLQNGGGGNQIGYDGRYTDPLGRQFYLTAAYKF